MTIANTYIEYINIACGHGYVFFRGEGLELRILSSFLAFAREQSVSRATSDMAHHSAEPVPADEGTGRKMG